MKKFVTLVLAVQLAVVAGPVLANPELVRKYNCTACHAEEKKKYGPTYQQVALKYADDAGAAEKLVAKIKAGGSGVWGKDPMPPQPRVTDEDAMTIVQYILSVK